MVRAAVDGVVDFVSADQQDPRWHTRLGWLLVGMLNRDYKEYCHTMQTRHLLLATAVSGSEEANSHLESEFEHLGNYLDVLLDRNKDKKAKRRSMARKLSDAWAQEYGDPDDPKVQRNIDAVVAALKDRRNEAGRLPNG
jgi:hypothetical protein